jgi:deoxyuridine 5'-triphosphate nucleotidohydrolase
MKIYARSGLASKHGIEIGAGVVDEDYRGEVRVILRNHSNNDYVVNAGDRIAQLIVHRYEQIQVSEVPELSTTTARGDEGFGSSGK